MTQQLTWFRRNAWRFLRTGITLLLSLGLGFVLGILWDGGVSVPEAINQIISCLHPQRWSRLTDFWTDSWPLVLGIFLLLMLLELWIGRALFSPHLATRLILWELMAGVLVLMVGMVTAAETAQRFPQRGAAFFLSLLPALAACLLIVLALCWMTRRLLAPLTPIWNTMKQFEVSSGSNPILLSGMPHTELYEVGQLWNRFSLQTQVQLNDLQASNTAYQRLVPDRLLQILDKPDITALKAGDMTTQHVSLLFFFVQDSDTPTQSAQVLHQTVQAIGTCGGMVVSHDVGHKAIIAMFSSRKQARACASSVLDHRLPVTAACFQEPVLLGIFGGEHLLLPLALVPHMARRFAVMTMLRQFGAKMICCDGQPDNLRLLGWDDGLAFYEEIRWRGGDWLSLWQEAQPFWEQAMALYQQGSFGPAMRRLARVLSILPDDQAARWYLFRCEALRDHRETSANLDLLANWEECS